MNEARIAQYLDLIQRLLGCSGGEQQAILQGQRELWDKESLWTLQREAGKIRSPLSCCRIIEYIPKVD